MRHEPDGQGRRRLRHCRRSKPLQMGWALSPSGWHRPPIRTGEPAPRRGTLHEGRPAERAGTVEVAFGSHERRRVVTSCALSVNMSESATVVRSGSVVLTIIAFSGGTGGDSDPRFVRLCGAREYLRLTNERNRAGVAQSVERQPSKLNVAGSRPVSRSKLRGSREQRHAASRGNRSCWFLRWLSESKARSLAWRPMGPTIALATGSSRELRRGRRRPVSADAGG
jgi:hypothetical protein